MTLLIIPCLAHPHMWRDFPPVHISQLVVYEPSMIGVSYSMAIRIATDSKFYGLLDKLVDTDAFHLPPSKLG